MAFHREPNSNQPASVNTDEMAWALPLNDEADQALPIAEPVRPAWEEPRPRPIYTLRAHDFDDEEYDRPRRHRRRKPKEPNRLIPLFIGYGAMLGMLIASGTVAVVWAINDPANLEAIENCTAAAFEFLFTILVLCVALTIGRIRPHRTNETLQVAAWCCAFPVLAGLLVMNFCFVALVRELFGIPHNPGPGITVITFFLTCLQPAVVEEWFFRYLALGTLRKPLGVHGAVWISGLMFGFAHLLNPIGIPYLIGLGVCFGYLRVWSGGLALPMILHGIHNSVVLIVDHAM